MAFVWGSGAVWLGRYLALGVWGATTLMQLTTDNQYKEFFVGLNPV